MSIEFVSGYERVRFDEVMDVVHAEGVCLGVVIV